MTHRDLAKALALAVLWVTAGEAAAAPAEMRVLTDEINAVGERSLEVQASVARPSSTARSGTGLVWQGLVEASQGLAKGMEASVQLVGSRVDGTWRGNAVNAELQYVRPHDDEGLYWGARVELGDGSEVGESRAVNSELRPIVGYRVHGWHLTLNPAVAASLTGEDRKVRFEPAAKLAYAVNGTTSVGGEFFGEAGPVRHLLPRSRRNELALLVVDTRVGGSGLSFGLGRRLTEVSDRWVVKLITSFDLD